MPKPIRIVVDRSKDTRGGGTFIALPGRRRFACTDSRKRLSPALLSGHDVLVVCGQSLRPYTRPELAAVDEFVREGGGLLLAGDAGAFERDAAQAVDRMAVNALARLFGAAFLSADCPGARVDAYLRVSLRHGDVTVRPHDALGGDGGVATLGRIRSAVAAGGSRCTRISPAFGPAGFSCVGARLRACSARGELNIRGRAVSALQRDRDLACRWPARPAPRARARSFVHWPTWGYPPR